MTELRKRIDNMISRLTDEINEIKDRRAAIVAELETDDDEIL